MARQACTASPSVRMPPFRSLGTRAEKMRRRGDRVAERRMALCELDAEPGRQTLERKARKIGLGDLREQPGIERARRAERNFCALAFALEHREIEAEALRP